MIVLCQSMVAATLALGINQFVFMLKPLPLLHKHQNGSFWF
ncbi:hypothetical protein PSDI105340_13735 [Pseudoalteromonas distincta]